MAEEKNEDQKPKIHIDDDWKAQALAEKERLAKETASAKSDVPADASAASPDEAAAGQTPGDAGPRDIPPADFSAIVNSIAMQAIMALGGVEDPQTKKRYVDPPIAKFHIDSLEVLQEKTKGNLSDEEAKLIDQVLYQLRMNFVQVMQHLKNAQAGQDPAAGQTPPVNPTT
jgi:DNA replication initiation complex subunit (GINS family)